MDLQMMLIGGIATASLTVGFFFLRFWKRTGDKFFMFFAASFLVEGINRITQGFASDPNEGRPLFYVVRFISFCLIIIAIVYKNLARDQPRKQG